MSRLAVCLAFLTAAAAAEAQSKKPNIVETRFHRVHLRNGNVVDGQLIRFTRSGVLLKLQFGEMEIRSDLVKRNEDGKLLVEEVKVRSRGEQHRVSDQPDPTPAESERRDPFKPVDVPKPDDVEPTVVSDDMQKQVDGILDQMKRADEEQRVDLIQKLMQLGEEAALYIAQTLHQIPESIRSEAAEALSGIRSPKAMPALVDLLSHEDAKIRTQALNAIGGMQNPRHAQYLRPLLRDSDAIVRGSVILMLERLEDRSSFEPIAALATDSEKAVRTQALTSLYNMAKKYEEENRLYTLLRNRVRAGRGEIRADIVGAMGRLRMDGSWDDLTDFLRDPSPAVRQAAAVALSRQKPPESSEAGDPVVDRLEVERDRWAIIYLSNCVRQFRFKAAVPALINHLQSRHKDVRKAAASVLQLLTNQNLGEDYDAWSEWYDKTQE